MMKGPKLYGVRKLRYRYSVTDGRKHERHRIREEMHPDYIQAIVKKTHFVLRSDHENWPMVHSMSSMGY